MVEQSKSLRFVPPKEEAKNLPRYASYVVGNGMKLHGRVGDAKNSFNNRGWTWEGASKGQHVTRHSFILENVGGEWYVLYEIKPGLTKTELPWFKDYYADYRYGHYSCFYTESMRENAYCQGRLAEGVAKIERRAVSMTTDEYVNWRIAVELERRGIS